MRFGLRIGCAKREKLMLKEAGERVARIDDIPIYRWKTPLQRSIQILKRHRDILFKSDPKLRPASAIITTLAARVCDGERDIESALGHIVSRMGSLVNDTAPHVPNPVNPTEDLADSWEREPRRKELFWTWLAQAEQDFDILGEKPDGDRLSKSVSERFGCGNPRRVAPQDGWPP